MIGFEDGVRVGRSEMMKEGIPDEGYTAM